MFNHLLIKLITLLALTPYIYSVELTFELPDSAEQCFYEEIHQGIKSTIEFQVCVTHCVCSYLYINLLS